MAGASSAGPPSSPPLLWVPRPAPESFLLLSFPRSPEPSYGPKFPNPRRGQSGCPPGKDSRPQIDPLCPLDPRPEHHSHFPHTEQGRETGWFQQEGVMAARSLPLPPCTEGEALGSRERGRAQGPALRKGHPPSEAWAWGGGQRAESAWGGGETPSRQVPAFSSKPSHSHLQCCYGNGTQTGNRTSARRRGWHARPLESLLNFTFGAQVCQPGPAHREAAARAAGPSVMGVGLCLSGCVIIDVQVPCPGLSAQAFHCHTGPMRNRGSQPAVSSHQKPAPHGLATPPPRWRHRGRPH